jgi:hypothetical protein
VRAARYTGPCRTVVAQEWPSGRPVPLDAGNGRRFKVFFYPLSGSPGTAPRLATPAAEAIIDVDAGASVECRVLPGLPRTVEAPRWTLEAQGLGLAAFDAKVAELDGLTEEASAAFAARRSPTPADAELARRYLASFEILAEPPFLANYYRLNPSFWEWVRVAAGRSIPKTPEDLASHARG